MSAPSVVPRALLLACLLAGAAPARAGDTVGPETCKACHPAAYETWKNGPHARARDTLSGRSRDDARCLSCHSPQLDDGLSGVTCEACHGPGGRYSARYVMMDPELSRAVGLRDPDEKTCLACHTDSTPSLTRFEHAKKLPLIRHWDDPPGGSSLDSGPASRALRSGQTAPPAPPSGARRGPTPAATEPAKPGR